MTETLGDVLASDGDLARRTVRSSTASSLAASHGLVYIHATRPLIVGSI